MDNRVLGMYIIFSLSIWASGYVRHMSIPPRQPCSRKITWLFGFPGIAKTLDIHGIVLQMAGYLLLVLAGLSAAFVPSDVISEGRLLFINSSVVALLAALVSFVIVPRVFPRK